MPTCRLGAACLCLPHQSVRPRGQCDGTASQIQTKTKDCLFARSTVREACKHGVNLAIPASTRLCLPRPQAAGASHGDFPVDKAAEERQRRLKGLSLIAAVAVVLWNVPPPLEISSQAWHLFTIFVSTMIGIIAQPLPSGAVALAALGATVLTNTLSFQAAFSFFGGEVPWLVLTAMFLAQSFARTGLGKRIAYSFVSLFGAHPLGLAYSLVFSEAFLAPAIPSVAARSGGLILPLVTSMSEACGSRSGDGSANKLGAFLVMTIFQTSAVSSTMFLTANHPNPLTAQLVTDLAGKKVSWTLWALAASVPGLISLFLIPLLLWTLQKPTMRDSRPAQSLANARLKEMGSMSKDELIMALACGFTITMWVLGGFLGVNSTAAAIVGVTILLVSGVLDWDDCLANKSAWNTFTWFAAVIAFATQLKTLGFIGAVTDKIASSIAVFGFSWQWSCLLLALAYFYSHFFFASNLSHVSAMCQAFLSIAVAAGSPAMLAGLVAMYVSNFMGGLSYWGMSHAPMYYGSGFVKGPEFLKLGFTVSVLNLASFLIVGPVWWKFLGLW